MTRSLALFLVGPIVIVMGTAAGVAAQELRPAVFGDLGVANVYRAEDRSFGTELNVGGGVGIEWRRLGLDVIGIGRASALTFQRLVARSTSARRARDSRRRRCCREYQLLLRTIVCAHLTGSVGVLWTEGVNSGPLSPARVQRFRSFVNVTRVLPWRGWRGRVVDAALSSPEFRTRRRRRCPEGISACTRNDRRALSLVGLEPRPE
jgi:hypothetical protein